MIIDHFEYNGQNYWNISKEYAIDDLKIPPEFIEKKIYSQKWNICRKKRNRLLRETDWTQVPDAPLSGNKKKEFKEYRQTLRNIPATYEGRPDEVVWPEMPKA